MAGKAESIEAGVRLAEEIIDSGKAMAKLEEFIAKSNQ
jgi:anthranilate phosphoribosyltransferase